MLSQYTNHSSLIGYCNLSSLIRPCAESFFKKFGSKQQIDHLGFSLHQLKQKKPQHLHNIKEWGKKQQIMRTELSINLLKKKNSIKNSLNLFFFSLASFPIDHPRSCSNNSCHILVFALRKSDPTS